MHNYEQYSVYFCTGKANFIRQLLDSLKEFMSEASLRFTPDGISLSHISSSQTSMAHLSLPAKQFKEYYVSEGVIDIGVDLQSLNRLTKSATNRDVLAMYIMKDSTFLNIKIVSDRVSTEFKTPILDVDITHISPPSVDKFSARVIIDSIMLQKLLRDFDVLNDEVELCCDGKCITLSATSALSVTRETTLFITSLPKNHIPQITAPRRSSTQPRDVMAEFVEENGSCLYTAKFKTSQLVPLTKTSTLSSLCELRLINDGPLILRYFTGDLGVITYAVQSIDD